MTEPTSRLPGVWRRITSVPGRAVLSLGLLAGFGAVGTMASWSVQTTLDPEPLSAGTLDIRLGPDGETWRTESDGKLWEFAVVELDDVAPGESVAMDMWIKNGGTTPLTFTATARTSSDELSPALTVTTVLDGRASNTGRRQDVDRTGTCSGGTETWWRDQVLTTADVQVTPGGRPRALAPGEALRVCMLATFSAEAPSSMQGRSTVIEADFRARQEARP